MRGAEGTLGGWWLQIARGDNLTSARLCDQFDEDRGEKPVKKIRWTLSDNLWSQWSGIFSAKTALSGARIPGEKYGLLIGSRGAANMVSIQKILISNMIFVYFRNSGRGRGVLDNFRPPPQLSCDRGSGRCSSYQKRPRSEVALYYTRCPMRQRSEFRSFINALLIYNLVYVLTSPK